MLQRDCSRSLKVSFVAVPLQQQQPGDALFSLLASLNLSQFLGNFEQEQLSLEHLQHLTADELKSLIPAMGPRKTLQAWISQKWPQQQQQQSAVDSAALEAQAKLKQELEAARQ